MGFFNSWQSHYTAGFSIGLALRWLGTNAQGRAIESLDRWAWAREEKQGRQKDKDPTAPLGEHKVREAMAWGAGARAASGSDFPYPAPPYPEESVWMG